MTKSLFAGVVLGIATLSLSACGGGTPDEVAAPDAAPGLSVTNARMVLAPVAGNPAAIYLDLSYGGEGSVTVDQVVVDGADSAMLHETMKSDDGMKMMAMSPLVINAGETVTFEPGAKHIMAMGVSPELQAGGSTEATIIVAGGDKLSFPVDIRGAGEDR